MVTILTQIKRGHQKRSKYCSNEITQNSDWQCIIKS